MQKSYDDLAKKFNSIENSLAVNSKMNKIVKYFDNKLALSNKNLTPSQPPPPPKSKVCI
jgi:hypothetical protein